jgi:hypothetical protein
MSANSIRPFRIHSILCSTIVALCSATSLSAYDPITRTIDSTGDVGTCPSIAVVNGYLAVSYASETNQRLKLWYDNGAGGGTAGDMIANGTEVRVLDPTRMVTASGTYVGRLLNFNGRIAIAYCSAATFDLILWVDDGAGGGTADDAIANGSEIRVIDTAGDLGVCIAITSLNGKLAVAYNDLSNYLVKLWYDDGNGGGTAGDGNANGSEIRTITALDGQELAMIVVNGRLALAFQDFGPQNLMLWYDDGSGGGTADDFTANGTELRTVSSDAPTGFFNAITYYNGHIGVSYLHFWDASLRFWYDDGSGSGIADNGVAEGTEIRVIDAPTLGGGFYPSIAVLQNRLAIVSYGSSPDALRIWYDDGAGGGTAGDVAATASELRYFNSTEEGYYSSLTAVGSHLLVTAYFDGVTDDLKIELLEVATAPNAPSNLGPTGVVDGSSSVVAAPTLSFTQSDVNTSDTLAYQIQVDDSSDFSTPVVDYTSDSITQGSTSFAVGQAAGGGSYTVGAESQALAIGSYYWRVRSADATATSAWTVANSGAVAFVVTATPTVTTTAASSITANAVDSGGDVTDAGSAAVTARGVCWSTASNPTTADSKTTDGSGTGSFSSSITGLSPGTLYYVRAYATNSVGTAYGSENSFTTSAVEPTVTTTAASSITANAASSGGDVTDSGGAAITARGVCWSTASNPTTADSKTTDGTGTGSFASSLSGLTAETVYYIRAYATNSAGTAYGNEIQVTTAASPPDTTTTSDDSSTPPADDEPDATSDTDSNDESLAAPTTPCGVSLSFTMFGTLLLAPCLVRPLRRRGK